MVKKPQSLFLMLLQTCISFLTYLQFNTGQVFPTCIKTMSLPVSKNTKYCKYT